MYRTKKEYPTEPNRTKARALYGLKSDARCTLFLYGAGLGAVQSRPMAGLSVFFKFISELQIGLLVKRLYSKSPLLAQWSISLYCIKANFRENLNSFI